jgi:hypothetical protein
MSTPQPSAIRLTSTDRKALATPQELRQACLAVVACKQWHPNPQTSTVFGSHSAPTSGHLGSHSPPMSPHLALGHFW